MKRFFNKKPFRSGLAFVLALALLLSAVSAMTAALASTLDELYVDPDTGAIESENGPVSMDDWQALLTSMLTEEPPENGSDYLTLSVSFKLEDLSTAQLVSLAAGTVLDAKNVKIPISLQTQGGVKFTSAAIASVMGGQEYQLTSSSKQGNKLNFEQKASESPISSDADIFYAFMTGSIKGTATISGSTYTTSIRLSDDAQLLALIDGGVINNWGDILFYRATGITVSASPKVSSATSENSDVSLTATLTNASDDTCCLWQEAPLNEDGSFPSSGWTNTTATEQNLTVQANLTTVAKAYRCLVFPNASMRTAFLNDESGVLYRTSDPVSLLSDHDRTEVFPQMTPETTWADLQLLLATANFPGTFTISQPYVFDNNGSYLTLDHLSSLASGTVPAGNTGYTLTLTVATDDQHKFMSGSMYSGGFGETDTLINTVSSNKGDLKQHAVTLKNGTVTAADLFRYLKEGSIYEELTMNATSPVERKAFSFALTADPVLLGMLNNGLVANWSDLYFYRAAQGTASVSPELDYSTESGATLSLLMNVPLDPNGTVYEYLWERAPIGPDGSMPDADAFWESIGAETKDTSVSATLDSIRYAYRAVVFPNATAKANYLNDQPTLCFKSNAVTLVPEAKRPMVYPAAFAEGFTWADLQYLLSDNTLIADVYYYSQVYGDRPQPQLSGAETLTGKETENGTVHYVSPDQMWVTLKIGVGGANAYDWYRSGDGGSSWSKIGTTTVPEYSMQMDASTSGYTYRCIATREGVAPFTSENCTFEPIEGTIWGDGQPGDGATYYGYLPATGNTAANHNGFGDTYNSHDNRGQYAFAPAHNANVTRYQSDGSTASMDKWVPEEAGKEGDNNVNREYTIHLKADFSALKEPDPVVYLITSDMDYATSDLGYARNWDQTIYNIGTGTEIKRALERFADAVTSDYSGSFIGFSYTGHSSLPAANYIFAAPYFTNTNATANAAFATLHTYGVCGNGHWDSGFSQIATCFSGINRSVVEKYMFGDDQNRLSGIKRVAISIAGSNENGYAGNRKSITDLFGKNYDRNQDFWYGILTTDGTGNHWLNNSSGSMTGFYSGKVTEDAIYNALMAIHNSRVYDPALTELTLHDIVRSEFEVVIPSGASVTTANGLRTATWTAGGDVYTAKFYVDANGNKLKSSNTEVTIEHTEAYHYRTSGIFERTISIRACEDYIGSNDVYTNLDPAYLTYKNAIGEDKESRVSADTKPTVNVPLKLMDLSTIQNWLLKGDNTDLDALGEEFIQSVYDFVYGYEQVNGKLDLSWVKENTLIAASERVQLDYDQSPRPFPETQTENNRLANVHTDTEFTGIVNFYPDEATNGKVSIEAPQDRDFARTTLTVVPVTPEFSAEADAVWFGEKVSAHRAEAWNLPMYRFFSAAMPAQGDISDSAYERMSSRLAEDSYLTRLNMQFADENWEETELTADTVPGDLGTTGKKLYKAGVSVELNGETVVLYDGNTGAGEPAHYPRYTVYQAKPDFAVSSYTMGLTKDNAAASIPILRSNEGAGLVSVTVPETAPAWAEEKPALWSMLQENMSAYMNRLTFSFGSATGLDADETLTTDTSGTSLLLTEQHAHGSERAIVPGIEVHLASDTGDSIAFTTLEPKLFVVDCRLTVAKNCEKARKYAPDWNEDWRFPINVAGPLLSGMTVILAPDSQQTIGELVSGSYTVTEDGAWIANTGDDPAGNAAWTTENGSQTVTLSVLLKDDDGNWQTTPVYRSDNAIAPADGTACAKTVSITNTYTGGSSEYLEDQVTNSYTNGEWRQK